MRFLSVFSAFLIGAGLATTATAAVSYFTRYSMFDALYAEIDSTLFLRITAMTTFEKTAIICGVAAVLIALVLAVVRFARDRRSSTA